MSTITLWHGTLYWAAKEIDTKGIKANDIGMVYATTTPERAEAWARTRAKENDGGAMVVEFTADEDDVADAAREGEVVHWGDVPASAIVDIWEVDDEDGQHFASKTASDIREMGPSRLDYSPSTYLKPIRVGIIDTSLPESAKAGDPYFTTEQSDDRLTGKPRDGAGTAEPHLAAFIDYSIVNGEIYIHYMSTRRDARNRGYASKLLEWVYAKAEREGLDVNWGKVFDSATGLFEKYRQSHPTTRGRIASLDKTAAEVMTWEQVKSRYPVYAEFGMDHAVNELAHILDGEVVTPDLTYTEEMVDLRTIKFQRYPDDDGRMASLMAAYQSGTPLPPVLLVRRAGELHTVDGHHRLSAQEVLGRTSVPAVIANSLRDDAYSGRASIGHTASDKGLLEGVDASVAVGSLRTDAAVTPKQTLVAHIDEMHRRISTKGKTLKELQTLHARDHHRSTTLSHYHEGLNLGAGDRPEGWYTGTGVVMKSSKTSALDNEALISVAEHTMERMGLVGDVIMVPEGHMDDPTYQAAIQPLVQWVSDLCRAPTRFYASDYTLDRDGGGAHGMVTPVGSIVVRPITNTMTILHEVAHVLNRSTHGQGHDDAYIEILEGLYRKHIGDRAADQFLSIVRM
jgi:GNAT superfamily N-acetyltransferase